MIQPFNQIHEERDILKQQSTWTVAIGDSFTVHTYKFKASSHLSINTVYTLLIAVLRLTGYKK